MAICIVDIDGVLNYYPECYIKYVNEVLNRNFESLSSMKNELSYNDYKKIKSDYRVSSYKENLKVRKYAKELLSYLREQGYIIVLMTARPIFENQRVFESTIKWLRKNDLIYDDLFFTDKKNYTVTKYFNNVDIVIEDNASNANKLCSLVNYTFLVSNDCNDTETIDNGIMKVKSLEEIVSKLEELKCQ